MRGFEINYEKAMKRFGKLFEKSISSLSEYEENMRRSNRTLSLPGKRDILNFEEMSAPRSMQSYASPNGVRLLLKNGGAPDESQYDPIENRIEV